MNIIKQILSIATCSSLIIGAVCSCGPSKAEIAKQQELHRQDSIWNSFTTPVFKLHGVKGHVTELTYNIFSATETATKTNKVKTLTTKFDKGGVCMDDENIIIPPLWITLYPETMVYNEKLTKIEHVKFRTESGKINCTFDYDEKGRLFTIGKFCNEWEKYGMNLEEVTNGEAQYDEAHPDLISKFVIQASVYDPRDYYTYMNIDYNIENVYQEFDEKGNWTVCFQKFNDAYYLIEREIETIPFTPEQ